MGNFTIKVLCYADDIILIAENEDDLQRLLYKTKTESSPKHLATIYGYFNQQTTICKKVGSF